MKKSKFILIISGIFILTIGSLFIIKAENDHKECETVVKYSVGKNGEKIKTTKHICLETLSF